MWALIHSNLNSLILNKFDHWNNFMSQLWITATIQFHICRCLFIPKIYFFYSTHLLITATIKSFEGCFLVGIQIQYYFSSRILLNATENIDVSFNTFEFEFLNFILIWPLKQFHVAGINNSDHTIYLLSLSYYNWYFITCLVALINNCDNQNFRGLFSCWTSNSILFRVADIHNCDGKYRC